jgi:hypothetical protein
MSEEFSFASWISEGARGIRSALRGSGGGLLPEEFRQHMKASRKEFLMAFRSLIDSAIDKVDKPKPTTRRKTTKIKVE